MYAKFSMAELYYRILTWFLNNKTAVSLLYRCSIILLRTPNKVADFLFLALPVSVGQQEIETMNGVAHIVGLLWNSRRHVWFSVRKAGRWRPLSCMPVNDFRQATKSWPPGWGGRQPVGASLSKRCTCAKLEFCSGGNHGTPVNSLFKYYPQLVDNL